jgi:hypothetical protein
MSRKCEANRKHAVGIGKVSRMDLKAVEVEALLNSPTAFAAKRTYSLTADGTGYGVLGVIPVESTDPTMCDLAVLAARRAKRPRVTGARQGPVPDGGMIDAPGRSTPRGFRESRASRRPSFVTAC